MPAARAPKLSHPSGRVSIWKPLGKAQAVRRHGQQCRAAVLGRYAASLIQGLLPPLPWPAHPPWRTLLRPTAGLPPVLVLPVLVARALVLRAGMPSRPGRATASNAAWCCWRPLPSPHPVSWPWRVSRTPRTSPSWPRSSPAGASTCSCSPLPPWTGPAPRRSTPPAPRAKPPAGPPAGAQPRTTAQA